MNENKQFWRWRVGLGLGFVFGALSHFGWLIWHQDPFYYGPAPSWAVWFWYGLSILDFIEAWLLLRHPKVGIGLGMAMMAFSLFINWTQFPTFDYGPNPVLWGLTLFGIIMLISGPIMLLGLANDRQTGDNGRAR